MESVRDATGKVSQRLLLNLGRGFSLPEEKWPALTQRIAGLMANQLDLWETDERVEVVARRLAKQLRDKQADRAVVEGKQTSRIDPSFESVDVNNLHHHDIRTIGGEHVALSVLKALQLPETLSTLGMNHRQVNIALGQIIGRLLHPGSERRTHSWLTDTSGLEELLGCDFSGLTAMSLYRVSDNLLAHKDALETHLYQQERDLLSLRDTLVLYDLTNTYIEGSGKYNEKARFGRSKDKRSDCRLVTLGLAIDGNGFARRTQVLPGNVGEVTTLKAMLGGLQRPPEQATLDKPLVVLDAGIVSEANLSWLKANNYEYIVVSRQKTPTLPEGDVVLVKEEPGYHIQVVRVAKADEEVALYCHSTRKAEKEQSIQDQGCVRFEEGLEKLAKGLQKKKGVKAIAKVSERLGRLKQQYRYVARRYDITLTEDSKTPGKVTGITWTKKDDEPRLGIYCLRCSRQDVDARDIWQTYITLTEVEASFRAMKSELGMRPVYHQKTHRVDGHLWITVLAYHVLQTIRYQLKQAGIHASWATLRDHLNQHVRLTTSMTREDGKAVHLRKAAVPTIMQRKIYDALSLAHYPGTVDKTVY